MNIHAISRPLSALLVLVLLTAVMNPAMAAPAVEATLYKNPSCQCCDAHAAYLRGYGFDVTVIESHDLERLKSEHGVPPQLAGCHTILVGGYVVEGHVPADVIQQLLRERPDIRGVSLPGMPQGSPGMTGQKQGPFVIYTITDDEAKVYAVA
ncbi:MAG: hypothetical protein H0V62_10385 [Gammaproteobacteria bacterium]|nr:hypothetical protein [Gammaproteobacteria bacterium]